MKFFALLVIIAFASCRNEINPDEKFSMAVALINEEKINEADSLFHTLEYNKKIDFNYKLLEIIIDFKYGRFDKMLIKSQDLKKNYPDNCLGYYYTGLCEFNLKEYISAEVQFDEAMSKFNKSSTYGFVYLKKSTDNLNFEENSIYYDLIFMIGLSKRSIGKYQSAIPFLELCLNYKYRIADSYLIIGDCYANLGDKINAKQFYLLALKNGSKEARQFLY